MMWRLFPMAGEWLDTIEDKYKIKEKPGEI